MYGLKFKDEDEDDAKNKDEDDAKNKDEDDAKNKDKDKDLLYKDLSNQLVIYAIE